MRFLFGFIIAALLLTGCRAPSHDDAVAAIERRDFETARTWLLTLAEAGDAKSQFTLGSMYLKGEGVTKNDEQGLVWLEKSAEQGNIQAQHALGHAYDWGEIVPRSDELSVKWYRRAAEQGDALAQSILASKYSTGFGVAEDDEEAYFWWLLASASGDENYRVARDLHERSITAEQRASAQARAREWKPKTE